MPFLAILFFVKLKKKYFKTIILHAFTILKQKLIIAHICKIRSHIQYTQHNKDLPAWLFSSSKGGTLSPPKKSDSQRQKPSLSQLEQTQRDMSGWHTVQDIWPRNQTNTVATAPAGKGSVFVRAFRLFLGQCTVRWKPGNEIFDVSKYDL